MQYYLNKFETTLVGALAAGESTSVVEFADASRLILPTDNDEYTLTITDGENQEVVTAYYVEGNMVDLQRAREGTEALAWPAGSQVKQMFTAGMADYLDVRKMSLPVIGEGATSNSDFSVAVGKNASVAGSNNVSVGYGAKSASAGVAIGRSAEAENSGDVMIGYMSQTSSPGGDRSTAVGYRSGGRGRGGVCVGYRAVALLADDESENGYHVAIGHEAYAKAKSITIGPGATSNRGGISIGEAAEAEIDLGIQMVGIHYLQRSANFFKSYDSSAGTIISNGPARQSAAQIIVSSRAIDMGNSGLTISPLEFPSGMAFYMESIDIVQTRDGAPSTPGSITVTAQPGNVAILSNYSVAGYPVKNKREKIALSHLDGVERIEFAVDSFAGSTHWIQVIFHGYCRQNS
jgi:hypothetical protein